MADADEHNRLEILAAEHVCDLVVQPGDIVTEPACADVTEAGEIFAELRRFDDGRVGQRLTGDGGDAVLAEALQAYAGRC